ncbi:signal transduction histidine kinase [Aminobacter aminovorans]|uniref:Signal transduction histidine-protein kinase/phosphatase MprB n=1 Tax=Aminobacter aminovorans TaxID=83263 RepID=A0A380WJ86_AMIAI|nr:histidine kinase dimerization/phospho-acceptor domain-containing protein [Aminobacter aminovorans]TCS19720.1 signal transduction histidine kinase [Aminobacter aminovorans]SUU88412.1 Sensor protein CreC [Aminobacter aminovorans]
MPLVVAIVCASLLAVPIATTLALQIGTNRLVNETETSLIKQAAIYAGAYVVAFEAESPEAGGALPGYYLPPPKRIFWSAASRTFRPLLNLRQDVVEPVRPDPVPTAERLDPRYLRIAPGLSALADNASRTTLSTVVFLDHQGIDMLARQPASFAAVPEVRQALQGDVGAALRWRSDAGTRFRLAALGGGTGFRVLIAYPVISQNRVIGAVYLSRTAPGLTEYFAGERIAVIVLVVVTLLSAAVVGTLLVRTMLRPIRALRDQSRMVASGGHSELAPLNHYGMREIAELGEAVITMAGALSRRSKEISIYTNHVTHELKSPVTSIMGAAELLEDGHLSDDAQQRLIGTIKTQGERMDLLLHQLRDMTRSREGMRGEPGQARDMLPEIAGLDISLAPPDVVLPLSVAHGQTVLAHMAQNARHHRATRLDLDWDGRTLRLSDNGEGFADIDLGRLPEPFFTTRREDGGTGLGLAIVVAILDLYGARLTPVAAPGGAVFEIVFD